jgi:hypothetical protein
MSTDDTGDALASLTPNEAAALLAALVDELIPGDDNWPAASTIGVQGLVAARLFDDAGEAELGRIASAVIAAGGPLAGRTAEERIAIVERFAAAEPDRFETLRAATVLAYYESPYVAAAIRQLGRPYALRPHLKGYPFAPFDAARDKPQHGRGKWTPTDAVKHVDASGLKLDETRTTRWGLQR